MKLRNCAEMNHFEIGKLLNESVIVLRNHGPNNKKESSFSLRNPIMIHEYHQYGNQYNKAVSQQRTLPL